MLSEKLGLSLQETEVDQILQKVDKNADGRVVFSEFLPLCQELLCTIYSRLNVETAVLQRLDLRPVLLHH
jgi:hypothetical protein